MKKLLAISFIITSTILLYAQNSGTPNTLRVLTDSSGNLLIASTALSGSTQSSVFSNTRLNTDASGNLLVVLSGGSAFAPADATYITKSANTTLTNEFSLGTLTTGLLLNTVSGSVGTPSAYTGTSCTNQVLTALNASAVGTCTTITSSYVNNTIALTGTDINTSNQVTATHLSAALPATQGGTGLSTGAIGDLIYVNATTPTFAKLSDVAVGSFLVSGGVNTAPVYSSSPTGVTSISFSGTPASAGVLRLSNNTSMLWRNAGNSADIGWTLNASDSMVLTGGNVLQLGSTSSSYIQWSTNQSAISSFGAAGYLLLYSIPGTARVGLKFTSTNLLQVINNSDTGFASIKTLAYLMSDATGTGSNYLEGWEQSSDPSAPATDSGRLFFKDNGAGKTQACIRFPTGATQCFATEP